jgi:y4mF family transcriptional regulator
VFLSVLVYNHPERGDCTLVLSGLKQFGEQLYRTRKQQGLTQEQLSAICGVGVRFIRELENGKESCHIGKAFHVAKMLGIVLHTNGED